MVLLYFFLFFFFFIFFLLSYIVFLLDFLFCCYCVAGAGGGGAAPPPPVLKIIGLVSGKYCIASTLIIISRCVVAEFYPYHEIINATSAYMHCVGINIACFIASDGSIVHDIKGIMLRII